MSQRRHIQFHKALPLLAFALLAMLAAGCKMGPLYGDLDGQWQIMQVTDDRGQDVPMETRYYYAFERNVVQLRKYPGEGYYSGNLVYKEPMLTMDFPYVAPEDEATTIGEWFISSNPCTMKVVKLDSKHLVLESGPYTVTCRKF